LILDDALLPQGDASVAGALRESCLPAKNRIDQELQLLAVSASGLSMAMCDMALTPLRRPGTGDHFREQRDRLNEVKRRNENAATAVNATR
jgi:hypothetical protein